MGEPRTALTHTTMAEATNSGVSLDNRLHDSQARLNFASFWSAGATIESSSVEPTYKATALPQRRQWSGMQWVARCRTCAHAGCEVCDAHVGGIRVDHADDC